MFRAFLLGSTAAAITAAAVMIISQRQDGILDKSPPHASADGEKCAIGAEKLKKYQPTEPPRPAPTTPFFDAEGGEKTLADYRGFGLVVNFWATWCVPCVKDMPALDRLQPMLKDDGIKVLTISEDRGGAEVVRKFYKKKSIANLPILLDRRSKLMRKLRIDGLPATLLIDAAGDEIGRVVGTEEWDSSRVADFIRGCLRAKPD